MESFDIVVFIKIHDVYKSIKCSLEKFQKDVLNYFAINSLKRSTSRKREKEGVEEGGTIFSLSLYRNTILGTGNSTASRRQIAPRPNAAVSNRFSIFI